MFGDAEPGAHGAAAALGLRMCRCGHKRKLHASGAFGAAAVPYPPEWSSGPGAADVYVGRGKTSEGESEEFGALEELEMRLRGLNA